MRLAIESGSLSSFGRPSCRVAEMAVGGREGAAIEKKDTTATLSVLCQSTKKNEEKRRRRGQRRGDAGGGHSRADHGARTTLPSAAAAPLPSADDRRRRLRRRRARPHLEYRQQVTYLLMATAGARTKWVFRISIYAVSLCHGG